MWTEVEPQCSKIKAMKSSLFKIRDAKQIPFSGEKQSLKGGAKDHGKNIFIYTLTRLRNYIISMVAYSAPSNKLRVILNRWKGVNIADNAYIGMRVFIDNAYPEFIYIYENAAVNAGSMLLTHFNPKKHFSRTLQARVMPVVIKKGAIVAVCSIINPGVTIGENAIVAAGSVVYDDVEDAILVRGNPAKKVGRIRI